MALLLALFFTAAAVSIEERQEKLLSQLTEVTELVHQLAEMTSDSPLVQLQSEINGLKDDVLKLLGEVSGIERKATTLKSSKSQFELASAENIIRQVTGMSEQVALLDGKLTNLDDRVVVDKIEEAMRGITTSDSQIKNIVYKLKDQAEYLDAYVKSNSGLTGIYLMVLVLTILVGLGYLIIYKASAKPVLK